MTSRQPGLIFKLCGFEHRSLPFIHFSSLIFAIMGKSKPSGAPPPPSEAVPAPAEAGVCAICYEVIEKNEEFMEGMQTRLGPHGAQCNGLIAGCAARCTDQVNTVVDSYRSMFVLALPVQCGLAAAVTAGRKLRPPLSRGGLSVFKCTTHPSCLFIVECSRCGRWNVHMDCGTGYLEEYISEPGLGLLKQHKGVLHTLRGVVAGVGPTFLQSKCHGLYRLPAGIDGQATPPPPCACK